MPWSLRRYYNTGALHFITSSCYRRRQFLRTPESRDLLLSVIERVRSGYRFGIVGYVVMPEHFHLLISEPQVANPSTVIQAIKLSFVRRADQTGVPHFSRSLREVGPLPKSESRHVWMRRFYDFNVWSEGKITEKLRYMHRNPVERGLVELPEDWKWSSFRAYACGEVGVVRVNDWSWWEEKIRSGVS